MNILIPHSFLKDYIKTNASVEDIAKALSLHSFSVEKTAKDGKDSIYEIEVTPNRGDALSVLGIARELRAVLPRMGFKASWVYSPTFSENEGSEDMLSVEISDEKLVPRFSAIVLDNVTIKDSPSLIAQRLEKVGIRPINNVVDITNYMMIDKGQPMHAFDYDKVRDGKMVVRESKEGETLVTLDGNTRELPEGVIVIEDGSGKLIDLCGIMGCENSEVGENTKRVLLFVQVYDPQRIRKASMTLGHRTDAALRFEKGIDFEGVLPALWESVDLMKKHCNASVLSKLVDIKNTSVSKKTVNVEYERINAVAGVSIDNSDIDTILTNLGFEVNNGVAHVPSWRSDDISIPEDLAEEVIRVYGYYNLPNSLPTGEIPLRELEPVFYWEDLTKDYLKHQGFFECYSYSATNGENVTQEALAISNPLTEDFAFMRTSLVPQLLEVLNENKGYSNVIKLFELASIYDPVEGDLPEQPVKLAIVTKGVDFRTFKGFVEGLYKELGVVREVSSVAEYEDGVLAIELDFEDLVSEATLAKTYTPLTGFNSIKEDMTFVIPESISYMQVEEAIYSVDPRIIKVSFKDIYEDSLTVALEYLDRKDQISSEDTQKIRDQIVAFLKKRLKIKLKG